MSRPKQFRKENYENILIYHYVEEMISDYSKFIKGNIENSDLTQTELPILLRIGYTYETTQKELVDLFNVSEGQMAKILKKFEERNYIVRFENPENRRIKIVKITPEGIEKTNEFIKYIEEWEAQVTYEMQDSDLRQLKNLLFQLLN